MTNHRSFTPEFKAQVVLEVLTGVRSASEACQHYPALARVAELERLVGRLTLELEVAKKASSLWQSHLSKGAK